MAIFSKPLLILFLVLFSSATLQASETAPLNVIGAETVDIERAKQLFDSGAVFVDLRADDDFLKGHIPNSVNLNIAGAFNQNSLAMIAVKDKPVVFYCYGVSCMRSYSASTRAVSWGYKEVKYFRTGMPAWRKANYPLVK